MKKYHMYLEYEGEGPSVGCVEYDTDDYDDASVNEAIEFYADRVRGNKDLSYSIDMLDWILHYADTYDVSECMYEAIEQIQDLLEERIQYILQHAYDDVEFIGIKDEHGKFYFKEVK